MRRFRFQLDPLLRVRRADERRRQRVVAHLEAERAAIEQRIRTLQERLAEGKQTARAAISGAVDLDVLRSLAGVSMTITRRANQLVIELAGVHRRLERAREDLREAMRRRRAVELLRERRVEEWRLQMRREEQETLDDLASSRVCMKKGEPV